MAADEQAVQWLTSSGMVIANNATPGRLVVSGAFTNPLEIGSTTLMAVVFRVLDDDSDPLLIHVDKEITRINDGGIPLSSDSVNVIYISKTTSVNHWMLY